MNATAIREGPCPPAGKQFLFAYAPHGVLGMCRGGSGGSIFPALYPNQKDVKWASFGHAFFIPGFREFGLMFGCVDAAKEVLTKVARSSKKYSIKIVPGGIREMLFTDGEAPTTKLLLKDRYGFVKLAKEEGLDLIPVFCFGEKWATKTVALKPAWLARLLLKVGFFGVFFIHHFSFSASMRWSSVSVVLLVRDSALDHVRTCLYARSIISVLLIIMMLDK